MSTHPPRRGFLRSFAGLGVLAAAQVAEAQSSAQPGQAPAELPAFARAMPHRALKQSTFDRSGGNNDWRPIEPGAEFNILETDGPGIVSHIWLTISPRSDRHLKEIVLRAYWEGNNKPSVEAPVGDFFGLNLGEYFYYQSAFMNCSSMKAMNCYFPMPFRKRARIVIANEGSKRIDALYANVDYKLVDSLPDDALYFCAQYHQATPNTAVEYAKGQPELNPSGKHNYVFAEIEGSGHLMGVTMGALTNGEYWFGEGDEMIFIDDREQPTIVGTGTEDYINGAWDFGGDGHAFGYLYNGAPFIAGAEHTGARYCVYRWHADAPVTFRKYLKHTIEHGHANDRGDNFFSVAYWYQTEPNTNLVPLPPVKDRWPMVRTRNA